MIAQEIGGVPQEPRCHDCGAPATIIPDDERLGGAGPYDVVCEAGHEQYVPAETTARSRILALREIAAKHSARRIDGYIVDATTANMLCAVYDALSKPNRERFGKPPLERLVTLGWSVVR